MPPPARADLLSARVPDRAVRRGKDQPRVAWRGSIRVAKEEGDGDRQEGERGGRPGGRNPSGDERRHGSNQHERRGRAVYGHEQE